MRPGIPKTYPGVSVPSPAFNEAQAMRPGIPSTICGALQPPSSLQ